MRWRIRRELVPGVELVTVLRRVAHSRRIRNCLTVIHLAIRIHFQRLSFIMGCRSGTVANVASRVHISTFGLLFIRCGPTLELLGLLPSSIFVNLQERVLSFLHQVLFTPIAMVVGNCEEVVPNAMISSG